jgi:D-alanine-D-alanine ligase
VVFGGPSAEHEVSAASALAVVRGLGATRFRPVAIGIGRDGRWRLPPARTVEDAVAARPDGPAIRDRLTAEGVQVELRRGGRLAASGSPAAVIERLDRLIGLALARHARGRDRARRCAPAVGEAR